MLVVHSIIELNSILKSWNINFEKIAFIPTMGNLHNGHLSLIKIGKLNAKRIIVSIFVNPTQFEKKKELENYPSTINQDLEKLKLFNVDIVFLPTIETMYPKGIDNSTYICVPKFDNILEGESRTGHFKGVATIISKFLNIIKPNIIILGEKDFQQLILVSYLINDMFYETDILSAPIVREPDGLACSSRNVFLNAKERIIAPKLNEILKKTAKKIVSFKDKVFIQNLLILAKKELIKHQFVPDILEIRDANNLDLLNENSKKAVLLFSTWLGKTRLIDNIVIKLRF